jgi:hypothetical protein
MLSALKMKVLSLTRTTKNPKSIVTTLTNLESEGPSSSIVKKKTKFLIDLVLIFKTLADKIRY